MRILFFLPLCFILSTDCAEEVLFATKHSAKTGFPTIKDDLEIKTVAELSYENTQIKKTVDDLKRVVQELMTQINDNNENEYCAQTYCKSIDQRITDEQDVRKQKNEEIEASIEKETNERIASIEHETNERHDLETRVDCSILPDSVNPGFDPGCPGAVTSHGNPYEDYCKNVGKANNRYQWHQNCCKWEKQQCIPINEGGLELFHWNDGNDCYPECSSKSGPCAWCGSKGMCCRQGLNENGCNGNIGGLNHHECSMYDDNQSIYKIDAQVNWIGGSDCDCDLQMWIYDNYGNYCGTGDLDWYADSFEHGRLSTWAGQRLSYCDNWTAKGGVSHLWLRHGGEDGLGVTDWYITGSTKTYHCPDGKFIDDGDEKLIKCY